MHHFENRCNYPSPKSHTSCTLCPVCAVLFCCVCAVRLPILTRGKKVRFSAANQPTITIWCRVQTAKHRTTSPCSANAFKGAVEGSRKRPHLCWADENGPRRRVVRHIVGKLNQIKGTHSAHSAANQPQSGKYVKIATVDGIVRPDNRTALQRECYGGDLGVR